MLIVEIITFPYPRFFIIGSSFIICNTDPYKQRDASCMSTTPDRSQELAGRDRCPQNQGTLSPLQLVWIQPARRRPAGPQVLWRRPANDRTVLWRVATPGVYFNSYSMVMTAWQSVTLVLRRFVPHSCHGDGVYGRTGIPIPGHQA